MIAGGGGAVGLLAGGVLTQYANWRWIFFINVPIAIIVLFMARQFVPRSTPQQKQGIDYLGAVTITGSLMSLVYALAEAPQRGWGSSVTISSFIISAALMIVFILTEINVRHPLIKLGIFKRRNVSGGSILQILMPAALFGMFFFLSIYLQQILGYSPTKTGAADVPFTIALIAVAGILSQNLTKINTKLVLIVAPLVVAAGLGFFARIPVHANYVTDILPGILLMSCGMGAVFVTGTVVTTGGASQEESGLISGLLNACQQVGGSIGLAVLSVVSTSVTKHDLLTAHGNPVVLQTATVHGFQRGFLLAAGIAVAASFVALVVLKVHKPSSRDLAHEPQTEAESLSAIPGV